MVFIPPFLILKKEMGILILGKDSVKMFTWRCAFFILQMQLLILLYMDSLTMLSEENL